MSYEYSFADNIEYGAEDLNKLVRSLVSSGVADPFADGVSYNAEKINDIVKTVYSDGVVPDSVDTLKVSRIADGTISIAPGLAFFKDGSTIRITEAHQMPYTQGAINYVYLKQDLAEQNRNYPVCSTDGPVGDDYVLLAEIGTGGSITDKRTYAKGRVPGYQSNANCSIETKIMLSVNVSTSGTTGTKSYTVDMGVNNYSRVFVLPWYSGNTIKGTSHMGLYTFADDSYLSMHSIPNKGSGTSTDKLVIASERSGGFAHPASLRFSLNGSKLSINLSWALDSSLGVVNFPFKIILC